MPLKPSPISEPFSGADLLRDLSAVRHWSLAYWKTFPPSAFFASQGNGWSPADHVRHLTKSNRPVAKALALPRLLLLLRFGRSRRPSRTYGKLVDTYRLALASGLKAGGYSPRPLAVEERTDAGRLQILERLSATFDDLARHLDRWSERSLDRIRLPHPGLGPLTVREMAMFTIYHNSHHVLGVAKLGS